MEMRDVLEMDPYENQFTQGADPEVPFPGVDFFLAAQLCELSDTPESLYAVFHILTFKVPTCVGSEDWYSRVGLT